jgi:hypothetical protein
MSSWPRDFPRPVALARTRARHAGPAPGWSSALPAFTLCVPVPATARRPAAVAQHVWPAWRATAAAAVPGAAAAGTVHSAGGSAGEARAAAPEHSAGTPRREGVSALLPNLWATTHARACLLPALAAECSCSCWAAGATSLSAQSSRRGSLSTSLVLFRKPGGRPPDVPLLRLVRQRLLRHQLCGHRFVAGR